MKRFTSFFIALCMFLTVNILGGVCVSADEVKPTEAPVINYTLSETGKTDNPVMVNLDITDDEEIVDVRYVPLLNHAMSLPLPPFDSGVDSGSIPYTVDCYAQFIDPCYTECDPEKLTALCGNLEAGIIAYDYYGNSILGDNEDGSSDSTVKIENNTFTVYKNRSFIICAEDKTGNKTFKYLKIDNINPASMNFEVTRNNDFTKDYLATVKINVTPNPNDPINNICLYREYSMSPSAGGAEYEPNIQFAIDSYTENNLMIKPDENGIYYIKDYGSYCIIIDDEWKNFVTDSFTLYPEDTESKPEIKTDFTNLDAEKVTINISATSEKDIAKVEYTRVGDNDKRGRTLDDKFGLGIDRTTGTSFEAQKNKEYIVRVLDKQGGVAYKSVTYTGQSETPTQAPVINYTLSETDETWNPITVNLDITDDEDIVDVRYVNITHGWHYPAPPFEDGVDSGSISYDVDFWDIGVSDKYTDDELLSNYRKYCGGEEQGIIISDYYHSAFEYNDDSLYEDKNSIKVSDNKFDIRLNDQYIIYAEDKSGNKTFRYFQVNNIKIASANVNVEMTNDFTEDYLAKLTLSDIVENPNAPIKNIYVHIEGDSLTGSYNPYYAMKHNLEAYQRLNLMVEPVDGIYYLKDYGTYKLVLEDEWGSYFSKKFDVMPNGKSPNMNIHTENVGDQKIVANIDVEMDNIAKIEYVKNQESYPDFGHLKNNELFALGEDRTNLENNNFIVQPSQKYTIRILDNKGGVAYQSIKFDPSFYECSATVSNTQNNSEFLCEVTNNTEEQKSGKLVFACYGIDDDVLYTSNTEYVADGSAVFSYTAKVPQDIVDKITNVKAFVFYDFNTIKPLCIPAALDKSVHLE